MIDEFAPLIDSMLRAEILMRAAVIHERLVVEYGFTGNYQRTKLYVQEARPRIAEELGITPKELAGMHRRFEVIPGAQAQVDWGDEGKILAHMDIPKVYSFHMVLSYSRDPFCCFTTSQDLQTFFDCHRRAFAHFGGYVGDNSSAISCFRPGWSLPSKSSNGLAAAVGTTRRCRGQCCGIAGARPGRRLPGVRGGALPTEHPAGHRL
ncbi:DDE-type integrase/transposase/recombinase [Streptomyces colonosanans]|uniref:DDE-type integrase/transposase/recombinase n=1 Tax=Streptomyces colonosanans TaxID=1428652 RepID=UPI000ABE9920